VSYARSVNSVASRAREKRFLSRQRKLRSRRNVITVAKNTSTKEWGMHIAQEEKERPFRAYGFKG